MTDVPLDHNDPRMHQAIEEIEELIREHYPAATIEIAPSPEDPDVVHVYPTVDIDEPDEVLDLVLPRVLALQDAGVAIHVIPLRSLAAEERMRAREQAEPLGPAVPHSPAEGKRQAPRLTAALSTLPGAPGVAVETPRGPTDTQSKSHRRSVKGYKLTKRQKLARYGIACCWWAGSNGRSDTSIGWL